jgi:hypothetical protein
MVTRWVPLVVQKPLTLPEHQWNDECEQTFIRLKDVLTSPGRQHDNADALSRRPCKVCLRHQDRNTEEKSEPITLLYRADILS